MPVVMDLQNYGRNCKRIIISFFLKSSYLRGKVVYELNVIVKLIIF
jgi:hypothetical protein